MTAAIFIALVFAIALLHVVAVGISGRRLKHKQARLQRDLSIAVGVVVLVLMISYVAGSTDALTDFRTTPPRLMPFLMLHVLAAALLGLSRFGRRLADGIPLAALVGFQAFRIPVELILHAKYVDGTIPVQMTYLGRNFDIVTGVTAIVVAWLALRGKLTRPVLLAWNTLGLALLGNIVVVAMLSVPGKWRVFLNDPPNTFVAEMPYTWLPTVLVTTALLGHIVVYRVKWPARG